MVEDTGHKYYLVEAAALPTVLLRVIRVKELLDTGECATVAEATEQAGISRSAFYKYRDSISAFLDSYTGRIITFHALLRDRPGVLSSVLGIFSKFGANILTINQSIPVNGRAMVTVTVETHGMTEGMSTLMAELEEESGVIRIEIMSG